MSDILNEAYISVIRPIRHTGNAKEELKQQRKKQCVEPWLTGNCLHESPRLGWGDSCVFRRLRYVGLSVQM